MAFYVGNLKPSEHTVECLTNHEILTVLNAGRTEYLAWVFCPTTNEERHLGFDAAVENFFKLLVVQYKRLVNSDGIGIEVDIRQLWLLCWLFPRNAPAPYALISFSEAPSYNKLNLQFINGTYFHGVLFFDIWKIFDALCLIAYAGAPPPPPNFVPPPPFQALHVPPVDYGHVRLDKTPDGYMVVVNLGNNTARRALAQHVLPAIFPPPLAAPLNPIPYGDAPIAPEAAGPSLLRRLYCCHFGITPANYMQLLNQNFPPNQDAAQAAPEYFGANIFHIPFP